jgi:peptidoglycan/xylan/chitin deacetylase (PgdA/CDA1 family)
MSTAKLRLAILTGSDSEVTCLTIERLTQLSGVEVCGILLDTERSSLKRRWRNLWRNIRREGISYLWFRFWEGICDTVEAWASRVVPEQEVKKLLRESFPGRPFSLEDFTRLYGIPLIDVGNLNNQPSRESLQQLQPDLGIVVGTRVLKPATFSLPRLGCINLHKGRVPEYRGQPAGFWEIYDHQRDAGVTVHFVDDGLDTGDVVGEAVVPIHRKDSPDTLRQKLDLCGADLLAHCVSQLADGTAIRRPQPKSNHKPRTSPTRRQRLAVQQKLAQAGRPQPRWVHVLKTLHYLGLYHLGIYRFVRAVHQRSLKGRACILLYHRVNNSTCDSLTTRVDRFAEHLVTMRQHYSIVDTGLIVTRVKEDGRLPGSVVAIHFDDCYRDVYTNAAPLLNHSQVPACAFLSSGFIDTDHVFPHDAGKYDFPLENLKSGEVMELVEKGIEVGSHTVNHADLGRVSLDEAKREVEQSKRDLAQILGRPVTLFSFPYGRKWNIRPEVAELVRRAGYHAMFSAYGGYVNGRADLFDIRRIGMCGQYRALDLLMDIEGLSLGAWKFRWTGPQARPSVSQ